jgi:4-phytase/acid phosphatase
MHLPKLAGWWLALALAAPVAAAKPSGPLTVERVVMLMRHGVRPPTKNPPMPAGMAADPWPNWSVAPGWLTPHGAKAMKIAGRADRAMLARLGVLPAAGCPAADVVAIVSDSDQRTIATGDAYLEGLAPGCGIANRHHPQGEDDALFAPIGVIGTRFDPQAANAAVREVLGPGGIAAAERAERAALATIDRIYCGKAPKECGVTREPSEIVPAGPNRRPKLSGALDRGSTAAQILLLEYADGKPMAEVGWGRASATDIARVGRLHSTEFAILARPPYIAAANIAPIARHMLAALEERTARLSLIVGHDTNVASLAGLLDLHWQVPGFAADDPAPGGALGFELLRNGQGQRFVRAFYRSATLEQIRRLTGSKPYQMSLLIKGCSEQLCPLSTFRALVEAAGG